MRGYRQPNVVQVTADDDRALLGQFGEFGSDGTGYVVDGAALQAFGAVAGDRGRRGLLQGVVGEEPLPGIGEFGGGAAAQADGLHQGGGVVAVGAAELVQIAQQGRRGQGEGVDLGQRGRTGRAAQIGDVIAREGVAHSDSIYSSYYLAETPGFTPVIMAL